MSDYIDLAVVAKVIAAGLLFGAVLPLVFATGLRAVADADEALAHRCVTLLEPIPAGTGNAFCLR